MSTARSGGASLDVSGSGGAATLGAGRFRIVRRLGEGGFGVVLEAFDEERKAPVAIKTLKRMDGQALYRFKTEFRALADIVHPNLALLHELHQESEGGLVFFTMELVGGDDFLGYLRGTRHESDLPTEPMHVASAELLQQSVPVGGALDIARLRSALLQLVDGLDALHRAGKVHRDVKPSNVLVTGEGRVKVLDFGLVAETSPSSKQTVDASGTPAYIAPEQATGGNAAASADFYSTHSDPPLSTSYACAPEHDRRIGKSKIYRSPSSVGSRTHDGSRFKRFKTHIATQSRHPARAHIAAKRTIGSRGTRR